MRVPLDPQRPMLRRYAVMLSRLPAVPVQTFGGNPHCDGAGRIIVRKVIKNAGNAWIAATLSHAERRLLSEPPLQ
jgi:hypothetical protein